MSENDKKIVFKKTVKKGDPLILIDYLQKYSELSKSILKKVLNNGGVHVRLFSDSKLKRIRRATQEINNDSLIEFYYDPNLTNMEVVPPREILKRNEWGIWYKPQGLLSEGTAFGDHCSILRYVEKEKHKAWLIHRLDREAQGLMLIAYTKKAAALMSEIWQKRDVRKLYKVEVLGQIKKDGDITFPLDGKSAHTTYTVLNTGEYTTTLLVEIYTGRLHQIRRHMDMMGHPVIGDPKYGVGNKNEDGLKLIAHQLIFIDPITKQEINFTLPEEFTKTVKDIKLIKS